MLLSVRSLSPKNAAAGDELVDVDAQRRLAIDRFERLHALEVHADRPVVAPVVGQRRRHVNVGRRQQRLNLGGADRERELRHLVVAEDPVARVAGGGHRLRIGGGRAGLAAPRWIRRARRDVPLDRPGGAPSGSRAADRSVSCAP